MKVIIFKGYWTLKDVKSNPTHLFIFGDNDIKKGKKGQAIIRDEPNAIGIPTKKNPSFHRTAYYYDEEYEENIKKIDTAMGKINQKIQSGDYDTIVFPEDGIGTGLANLKENAPNTLKYINEQIGMLLVDNQK